MTTLPFPEKTNHRSRASFKKTMDGLLLSLRGKTRSRVGSPCPAIANPLTSELDDQEESKLPELEVLGVDGACGKNLSAAPFCKKERGKGGSGKPRHSESKWKDSLLKARLALRIKREKKKAKHVKLSEAKGNRKEEEDGDGDGVEAARHPESKRQKKSEGLQGAQDDLDSLLQSPPSSTASSSLGLKKRARRKRRPNVRLSTDIGGTSLSAPSKKKLQPKKFLRRSGRVHSKKTLGKSELNLESAKKKRKRDINPKEKERKKKKMKQKILLPANESSFQPFSMTNSEVFPVSGRPSLKTKKTKVEHAGDETSPAPPPVVAGASVRIFEESPQYMGSKMEMNVYAFNQPIVILSHIGIGESRENTICRLQEACVNGEVVCLSQGSDDAVSKGIQALLFHASRSKQEELRQESCKKTLQGRKKNVSPKTTSTATTCAAVKSPIQEAMQNVDLTDQEDKKGKAEGEGGYFSRTAWQPPQMVLENKLGPSKDLASKNQDMSLDCKETFAKTKVGLKVLKKCCTSKQKSVKTPEEKHKILKHGWGLCTAKDMAVRPESYSEEHMVCKEWRYGSSNPMTYSQLYDQQQQQQQLGDISQLEFPLKRPSVEELRAFAKTILNDG